MTAELTASQLFQLPKVSAIKFDDPDGFKYDWKSPSTKKELQRYLKDFFGLTVADKAVCPGHTAPLDAAWEAYSAQVSLVIWKASRGLGGKSTLLAGLSLIEILDGMNVVILGGSSQQSQRVHEVEADAWNYNYVVRDANNDPVALAEGPFKRFLEKEPGQYQTKMKKGNWLRALTASSRSARGPHPQRARLDEVDEMDLVIFDAAMGQTMEMRGRDFKPQTILSSTHQYPDGTFTEIMRRAAEQHWPVRQWCVGSDTMITTPKGDVIVTSIRKGDVIYGYANGQIKEGRVTDAWSSGYRETVIVETSEGELVCTPDHRILTNSGYKPAGDLRHGESVLYGLRTEVSLGQTQRSRSGALLPMSAGVRASTSKEARLPRPMPDMWGRETSLQQDVHHLLSEDDGDAEYGRFGCACGGSGEEALACGATIATYAEGRGALYLPETVVRSRSTALAIRGRLPGGECPRCGGQQPVLALASRSGSARQSKGEGSEEAGVRDSRSLGRRNPSLVQATVRRVRPGITTRVYDITVPELDSFLANGLVVHNCFKENHVDNGGWLEQREIDRKKSEVSKVMWNVEFELQEPSSEGRAIDTEAVRAMFDPKHGVVEDTISKCYYFQKYDPLGSYATGADWAKDVDATVIVTIRYDCVPARIVAYERIRRRPWPLMAARLDKRVLTYPGRVAHDATGVGDVVDDYLEVDTSGIKMVGRVRKDLFSDWIIAIEDHKVISPCITTLKSEHEYVITDDIYGNGHPPDGIVACAMAWRAVLNKHTDKKPGKILRPRSF